MAKIWLSTDGAVVVVVILRPFADTSFMERVSTGHSFDVFFIFSVQAYNTSNFLFAVRRIIGQNIFYGVRYLFRSITLSNSSFFLFTDGQVAGGISGTEVDLSSSVVKIISYSSSRTEVITMGFHLRFPTRGFCKYKFE